MDGKEIPLPSKKIENKANQRIDQQGNPILRQLEHELTSPGNPSNSSRLEHLILSLAQKNGKVTESISEGVTEQRPARREPKTP